MDYRAVDRCLIKAYASQDDVPSFTLSDMEYQAEHIAASSPGASVWVQSRPNATHKWQDESLWLYDGWNNHPIWISQD